MIKLVASDLDGTLLQNGSQSLDPIVIDLVKELKKLGIIFVAASGRQYANLRRLFEPVKDEIAYIAENGALVIYNGSILSKSVIDRNIGEEILIDIRNREGCEILLSGMNTSYLEPKSAKYAEHMKYTVKNNVTVVSDILSVTEDYLKISVCEKEGIENSQQYFEDRWSDKVTVVTSGNQWLDMIASGVNKGNGIRLLQKKLGILPEESMAFGDNYNDIEMLQAVSYDYAMKNGVDKVKSLCKYHTESVEDVLQDLIVKSRKDTV